MSHHDGADGRCADAIRHHPSDETLVAYAAGTLSAGPAVVAESHIGQCSICRERLAVFRAAGGAMLDGLPPTDMEMDALVRAQARIGLPRSPPPAGETPYLPNAPRRRADSVSLPATLAAYPRGRWMWMGPGMWSSRIIVPSQPLVAAHILRIAPGRRMPEHGHSGTEYTQVLHGAFSDGHARYGAGDFCEADADMEHQPVSDPVLGCVCVIAMEGQMRLRGFLGLIAGPFIAARMN
ncbi:ChrR family anti-sigma-E factor [Xanthobacteraceae bacterium A53D]